MKNIDRVFYCVLMTFALGGIAGVFAFNIDMFGAPAAIFMCTLYAGAILFMWRLFVFSDRTGPE